MSEHLNKATSNFLIRHASLRQIQVFECVARNLSFTRAAEELYLTQPTVSSQVKSLAEAIDMPLYEQVGRQIFLTEIGEEVACSCRGIIDQLSNLEIMLDDFRGLKRGRLRVAVITTAKYFAPVALGKFCKKYPDIELSLKVGNRNTILKRIDRNLDDLYILGQVPSMDMDLEAIPFAPNPLVIIAHANHELVGTKVSLKRLAKEPFIMREKGSGIRSAVEDLFAQHGLTVKERMMLETNEAIKHCVMGELGVACVSEHALDLLSPGARIAKLDVEGFPIHKEWNIVYPKTKSLSLLAEEFLKFLQAHGDQYLELDMDEKPALDKPAGPLKSASS
ncbi:LysR family transcriptional regulator [Hydrogenovibrio thermophilus]|uniref:LysR family transcriptional regulator n=1 Tax=Hydrogenovibrio thermophilus TaxID=265883 RepID=A0A410H4E6_9GAMM|nr:LysR family transcriptional regulator [Hydrogenovibrio thermophilus]QAB15805.1 LysR family transcriptional regulator [Hydrogenovibrio thermophilus]